ncbi:MAG: hypothetical protein LBR61_10700 [Synergistaceae bacterium]|nr:hypothetical protein [Synergistaceae bacterium]
MQRRYVWLFGLFVSLLLLCPLWWGKFWIIDDHEIVALSSAMAQENKNALHSFRSALAETEAGHWGQSGRYRPVYYFLRVLKIHLLGMNARAWFIGNFLVFFLSIVFVGLSIRFFYPWPFVPTGMLLFAALPCYVDMWGRLGPAEIDACLWTALFIYGFARYAKGFRFAWPIMCAAAFMAVGCKENFVLLLLPLSVLLVRDIWRKEVKPSQVVLFLCPFAMACTVWLSIALWASGMTQAVDMYGQSLSLFARAKVVFSFFYEGQRAAVIVTAFLLLYAFYCLAGDRIEGTSRAFTAMLVLSVCILGNYVFHNGETSLFLRYAYMEQLFIVALFFAALYPLRQMLTDAWTRSAVYRRRFRLFCGVLCFAGVLSIAALIRVNGFRARRTIEFDEFLSRLRAYDNVQIINLGNPISSYEPYYSLKRFAEAGLIPEVRYFPVWGIADSALAVTLEKQLKEEAQRDPAPPLTPQTALAEFSLTNGWFRLIEHAAPRREIEQTILISGWREKVGLWQKFFGITSTGKGRRSAGEVMKLALPAETIQPYRLVIDAVPFDASDSRSEAVFYLNGTEVKRTKLRDYKDGFAFEVTEDVLRKSPLHENLMLLETRIENFDPAKANGLTFYAIDVLPLP